MKIKRAEAVPFTEIRRGTTEVSVNALGAQVCAETVEIRADQIGKLCQ